MAHVELRSALFWDWRSPASTKGAQMRGCHSHRGRSL